MGNDADDRLTQIENAAKAHARGYEGQACPECGNWTLVAVSDLTLRCDTCTNTWSTDHAPLAARSEPKIDRLTFVCEEIIPQHSEEGC